MNSRVFWAALAAAFLVADLAAARPLPPSLRKDVDKVFAEWSRPGSPGCALGIYQDGAVIYARGYGMADLNEDQPITPETIFHVASMSKQFTAAAIILLSERGQLALDDDVHKYIPELPDFGERITIRELMNHTSGLRDQWALLDLAGWRYSKDLITDDDVMGVVTRQRHLNFKPGDRFLYSNTGFTLLGLIVKRVSGQSLRVFTAQNIFKPLGMSRTFFRDDHAEIIKHDAVGYERAGKDKPFKISITNFDTVGATSLHTTVEDLQRWDENFYHPKVGGPAFIQAMLKRGVLNSGEVISYASGLTIGTYRGLTTVEHGGADAGYRSDIRRFPDQHLTISVLCNVAEANPSRYGLKVADVLLKSKLAPDSAPTGTSRANEKAALSADQLSALAGLYWDPVEDSYVKVFLKDGHPEIDLGGPGVRALTADADGRLHFSYVPGLPVVVEIQAAAKDAPRALIVILPGAKPTAYHAVSAATPSPAELLDYVGPYLSEEIDPIYRVGVKDGALTLSRLKHETETLKPAVADVFTGEIGTVRFVRGPDRRITGFILDAGRIQNFRFARQSPPQTSTP